MVLTCTAAMEARIEELERRMLGLSTIERRQEEQSKSLELIAQQLGELLRERRAHQTPKGHHGRRSEERGSSSERAHRSPHPGFGRAHTRREYGREGARDDQ